MLLQCALLLVMVGSAAAQEQAEVTSHQRLAEELVAVLQLEEGMARSVDMMTKTMAAQPMGVQMQDVMREFYEEFMSWDTLRPSYVKIYMDAFTEAELEGLIEFYHTPLGQRLVEQTPVITEESAAAAQAIMQPHLPELQRRMMAKMRGGGL